MNILFIDVETTGTDPAKHNMIEFAGRLDVDGKTITRFSTKFFNPQGATIDLGALKVNKTKISELMALKPEIQEAANLIDWLLDLPNKVQGPILVCGQNVQFDVGFLKALLAKYAVVGIEQIIGYKYIDTFSLAIALKQAGILQTDKTNLEALGKAVGIDTSKYVLHTAEGDTNLVADVYYGVIAALKRLYDGSLQKALTE